MKVIKVKYRKLLNYISNCHASSRNLENLFKKASRPLSNISDIIKVVSHCKMCRQYKKPVPESTVGLPKANYFNDTVAMNLHQVGPNLWYLHLIDEFSRFCNAVTIKIKSTDIIIEMFLNHWISLFGSPNSVFCDNRGEFVLKEFIDFCENLNMKAKTTAAEASWSNNICDRNSDITTDIILKVRNYTNCDWKAALAWAISLKIYFINLNGFSPYQIVFGRNMLIYHSFTMINHQLIFAKTKL